MSGLLSLLLLFALVVGIVLWSRRIVTIIYPPNVGLLYRDGLFQRVLPPGRYVHLDPFRRTKLIKVSSAELPTQMGEITVLSKDQFSFRIGLQPVLSVTDARLFIESQPSLEEYPLYQFMGSGAGYAALQPLVAAAAMEVVSGRTLGDILANQRLVAEEIQISVAGAIPGASIQQILLTSINLPPETRRMFTDVERSKMEAQASLERARGEQAALRVLANAARLLNDNPALANLRLLQAVESSKGATTIVIGNPSMPLPGLATSDQK